MVVSSDLARSETVVSAATSARTMSLKGTLVLAFAGEGFVHLGAGAGFEAGELGAEFLTLVRIGDVVVDRGLEDRDDVLRGVGQRGVGTRRNALHALGAVFGDVDGSLAAGDVFGLGGAGAGAHDADGREGAGGLVVAEAGAGTWSRISRGSATARRQPARRAWRCCRNRTNRNRRSAGSCAHRWGRASGCASRNDRDRRQRRI